MHGRFPPKYCIRSHHSPLFAVIIRRFHIYGHPNNYRLPVVYIIPTERIQCSTVNKLCTMSICRNKFIAGIFNHRSIAAKPCTFPRIPNKIFPRAASPSLSTIIIIWKIAHIQIIVYKSIYRHIDSSVLQRHHSTYTFTTVGPPGALVYIGNIQNNRRCSHNNASCNL